MCLIGRVRIADLFPKLPVMIRYTTDDWLTWSEARCQLIHGTLWLFRVQGVDQSAVRVQYCVSYGRCWDNNFGRNFVLALPPVAPPGKQQADLSARLALVDHEVTTA